MITTTSSRPRFVCGRIFPWRRDASGKLTQTLPSAECTVCCSCSVRVPSILPQQGVGTSHSLCAQRAIKWLTEQQRTKAGGAAFLGGVHNALKLVGVGRDTPRAIDVS